jgi:hypothetical protein
MAKPGENGLRAKDYGSFAGQFYQPPAG